MNQSVPRDQNERQKALDISNSVIVQAPAGSGKTSLLTIRFLKLLSVVDAPEEIVAVTFTRKAAAEMRSRIVDALNPANSDQLPEIIAIAETVRSRDAERDWQLQVNPSRLRIHTIDALCTSLTRQLPWTSGFGAPPGLLEDSTPVYEETARRFLSRADDAGDPIRHQLRVLLTHFDNDGGRIEHMLASMLSRRDQWAERIVGTRENWRADLDRTIESLIEHRLHDTAAALETGVGSQHQPFIECVRFAAENIGDGDKSSFDGRDLLDFQWPLGQTREEFPQWKALAGLLLTKDGKNFRKTFRNSEGFPPKSKNPLSPDYKKSLIEIVEQLRSDESLVVLLDLLRRLPAQINDSQWRLLEALQTLLPQLLAELHLSFVDHGLVDYTEIALRAVSALDDAGGPSELALRLDNKISHVLVDEFQDTSSIQFSLISKLTRGWQPGDGRTLFVVGDPMQSIYRFRKADVQLFLNVWEHGAVGDLKLEPVKISVNFRSEAGVVEWVNDSFQRIFPTVSNAPEGAVEYSLSDAHRPPASDPAVQFHPQTFGHRAAEAEQVVDVIKDELARGNKTAILVRSRSHLADIVPALDLAAIPFQGLELVKLWDHETIHDLYALTRACQHPADRIAWLAVLRAPWCGLKLSDLHIVGADSEQTVIESLRLHKDDLHDADRVSRILPLLERMLDSRRRGPLRQLVEWLWIELGGPACIDETSLEDAERFFALLEANESGGIVSNMSEFEARLKMLYASPRPGEQAERVQIMTIYKAKGLEFDTVIVPRLGGRPRYDGGELLRLTEVETGDGRMEFLVAPRKKTGDEDDQLYRLIREFDRKRAANELDRLLYVACTRAVKRLHLFGAAKFNEKDDTFEATNASLLERLWPVCADSFGDDQKPVEQIESDSAVATRTLVRLPDGWQPPDKPVPDRPQRCRCGTRLRGGRI